MKKDVEVIRPLVRFTPSINPITKCAEMDCSHRGQWVRLCDHETLEDEVKKLSKIVNNLNKDKSPDK